MNIIKKNIITALLLTVFVSTTTAIEEGAPISQSTCICPQYDSEWQVVPDTSTSPPDFIWSGPILELRCMVICQHGVFFNFRAKDKGRIKTWWFAYPEPTLELYSSCVQEDSLQGEYSATDRTIAVVAEATKQYRAFRERLKETLGHRYKEDHFIRFNRSYGRPARLGLAMPLTFYLKNSEIEFMGIPEIYFRK